MPKRVAQVLGKMNSGGIEAVVMQYYRELDKMETQFDFYVDENSKIPQRDEIEAMGGKIFLLPSYSKVISYNRILKSYLLKGNYEVVHAHMSTMSIFPLFVAWQLKVPKRIAHSHSTASIYEFRKSILKYMLRPFSKIFATHYFACGEIAGRWLFGNRAFKRGKVTILENKINNKKFEYSKDDGEFLKKEFNINDNLLVIGHIGRICKQKNQNFIIKVFSEVLKINKDCVLIMVGEGDLSEITKLANRLNIMDKIIFTNARKDAYKFYSLFDIFLLPSIYEGFPVVCVEANANNLPLISSNKVSKEVLKFSNIKQLGIHKKDIYSWVEMCLSFNRKERF